MGGEVGLSLFPERICRPTPWGLSNTGIEEIENKSCLVSYYCRTAIYNRSYMMHVRHLCRVG